MPTAKKNVPARPKGSALFYRKLIQHKIQFPVGRRLDRQKGKDMIVDGRVTISLSLNVIALETDAVEVDEYGRVVINDPETFFVDWSDEWEKGTGELLGASDHEVDLEVVDEDEEEYEDEEDEDF
jgi:hypothetical protein